MWAAGMRATYLHWQKTSVVGAITGSHQDIICIAFSFKLIENRRGLRERPEPANEAAQLRE